MSRKGLNALEIVFGMFLLLIVVFVVIRLVTNFVSPTKVAQPLQKFDEAYKYAEEKSTCKDLCDQYLTDDCNLNDAVSYCLKKIKIDINGNKIPGEPKGGFVNNLPYCEDGLYCFHIYDCKCGSYLLDASTCRRVLCDFYLNNLGLSSYELAAQIITGKNGINFGSCEPDVSRWSIANLPEELKIISPYWWTDTAGYTYDGQPLNTFDPENPDLFVCKEYSSSISEIG